MHIYIYIYIYIYTHIYISGTSYFGEAFDPASRHCWKESLSFVFIKNLNTKFGKAEKNFMSLNGVLIFLTFYWLFFHIAVLKNFFETYS